MTRYNAVHAAMRQMFEQDKLDLAKAADKEGNPIGPSDTLAMWEEAFVFKGRGLRSERRAWQHAIDGERRSQQVLFDYVLEGD